MKSVRRMASIAITIMLLAGPAAAVDYQPKATFIEKFLRIEWPSSGDMCSQHISSVMGKKYTAVINGSLVTGTFNTVKYSHPIWIEDHVFYVGTLGEVTVNGLNYIPCGADRLLLPGYVAPAPASVPTLSEWAMILLGVLLAGGAALTIHRRRQVA